MRARAPAVLSPAQGHRFDDQRSTVSANASERNVGPKSNRTFGARGCAHTRNLTWPAVVWPTATEGAGAKASMAEELDDSMSFFEMLAAARKARSQ
jgi:hypothetical protein